MSDRLKNFKTALADKMPDTSLEELCTSLRQEPPAFINYIEQGSGLNPFATNVVTGILGCSLEEFIDYGCQLGDSGDPGPVEDTKDQTSVWVEKASKILQEGGQDAATLRHLLTSLRP